MTHSKLLIPDELHLTAFMQGIRKIEVTRHLNDEGYM